jgi:hypothetical protein
MCRSLPPFPGDPSSPQWRIIDQITVAQVLMAAGDKNTTASLLREAIVDAEGHRLPHQIQRIARPATRDEDGIAEAAAAALKRTAAAAVADPTWLMPGDLPCRRAQARVGQANGSRRS